MFRLIQNEWIKVFKQLSTYILIGVLLIAILAMGAIAKYLSSQEKPMDGDWKQELIVENEQLKQELEEAPLVTPSYKEFTNRQIALNEYRIQHDLQPNHEYNMWSFISESSGLISLAGLLVIVVAAGIVANEFTWGTIKVLLVKPFHRWKVLFAKYMTVNLFLFFNLTILFIGASIAGWILFGSGDDSYGIHLAYVNGVVKEQSQLFYLIKSYLLNSLSVFLLTTMAFMISVVFRSSSLSIGISIFLLLTGSTVTNILASKFDWVKYSLFANTNLMAYVDGMPLVEGMTMSFSITMILVYFFIFILCAFLFFTKRDIAV